MNQKNDLLFFRAVKGFGVGCPGWRGALQRCSELFSNSLGTKPEARKKSEIRSPKRRTARVPVCPSDFGLRVSFGSRTPTSSRARGNGVYRSFDLRIYAAPTTCVFV